MFMEEIYLHVEISRQPNIIGVQKCQQLAARTLDRYIVCRRNALISLLDV